MKLLESKRLKLPQVFLITEKEEIKDLPVGVPFIYASKKDEPYLILILEYEVLYQQAIKTGYPFNFRKILKDHGYQDLEDFNHSTPIHIDLVSNKMVEEDFDVETLDFGKPLSKSEVNLLKDYIKDTSTYVDIAVLKSLNVFPIWLDKIEEAVHTNIHNFAVFNNNMYNKKLEGMYGGLELTSPGKNLIIIDISGSIPQGVSSTCLVLAKNLAETFYADLMITGSKSTLYAYENIQELDIETIYTQNGQDNDQCYFKALVTDSERYYKTAIVFGDDDSPCWAWSNTFNKGSKSMTKEEGQKICKWKIGKLISFHTKGASRIAAYGDWFKPEQEERILDWVKYLK